MKKSVIYGQQKSMTMISRCLFYLPPSKTHHKGVKRDGILNHLDHLNIIDNKINDLMHTLLKVVIPYVMGAVLHSFSQIYPKVTLKSVNRQISQVFGSLFGPD